MFRGELCDSSIFSVLIFSTNFSLSAALPLAVSGAFYGVLEPKSSFLSFSSSFFSLSSFSSFDSLFVFMNLYILSKIPKPVVAAIYMLVYGFSFSFSLWSATDSSYSLSSSCLISFSFSCTSFSDTNLDSSHLYHLWNGILRLLTYIKSFCAETS